MLPVEIEQISAEDIARLIANQVEESQTLDYKRDLPAESIDAKREFLYDVAAFANTNGGYIVYGISDKRDSNGKSTGIPDKVVGVKTENINDAKVRLEAIVRDGIQPAVEILTKTITTIDGAVLVLQIPKSWSSPHMVTYQKVNKFYSRNNLGKELMNINQIRAGFASRQMLGEAIRNWRHERLTIIGSPSAPILLRSQTALVIHAVSADYFMGMHPVTSWTLSKEARDQVYMPIDNCGSYPLFNSDGLLLHSDMQVKRTDSEPAGVGSYVQVFREGALEYVDCEVSFQFPNSNLWGLGAQRIERCIVRCFENVIDHGSALGLRFPAYFGVSLTGIAGRHIYLGPHRHFDSPKIGVDRFTVPDILIDALGEEFPYPSALKPIVDTLAQVGGLERSPFVTQEGKWVPFKLDQY